MRSFGARRTAGRPLRAAANSGSGHGLVGRFHGAHRTGAAGVAERAWILLSVRFALGLGEAVVYPASNRLVAAWIPSQERGVANGIIFAGVGAGAGVTPPLITYILLNYGWRLPSGSARSSGSRPAIVWYLLARDRPAEHPWVDEEKRGTSARACRRTRRTPARRSAAVADDSRQPRRAGGQPELFLLRLRGLHFLHVVLHLSEHGARPGPEIELATTACCRSSRWRPARRWAAGSATG